MKPPPEPEHEHEAEPTRYLAAMQRLWNPTPIKRPRIDPNLLDLPWMDRSAEVLRYSILCVEHWLSQGGSLREFVRLNLWFGVILTVSAVLVIPPVTLVLQGAVKWTEMFSSIIGNIASVFIKLPPIILGIATIFIVVRWLGQQPRKDRRLHDRRHSHDGGFDGYH
ncbi:MAG: hypothetical protein ACI8UO_006178 [Verrucomicrobiales bacterium]|jgi:hypothetical protein